MKRGYGAANTGHLFGEYQYGGSPYDMPKELETVRSKIYEEVKSGASSENSGAVCWGFSH
jgi:hypothetical protein